MIKTVKQACRFNPIIRDYRMSQGIENLADLINDAGDGSEFFSRNFVTHGMDQLFREGLLRLSGKSDQAVFELTQAMGGGKTHMMIALGLLARHPNLRKDVLSADLTAHRIRSCTHRRIQRPQQPRQLHLGRNRHPARGCRSHQAVLGERAEGGRSAPVEGNHRRPADPDSAGRAASLSGQRQHAGVRPRHAGQHGGHSLSSLMSAALELPNCAIVVANLSGSYKAQTKALADAISICNRKPAVRR
jgi:hypothetical protein